MSLTILYRHPRRPDEAGVAVVADRAKATLMTEQLERRGYLIIDVAIATFTKPASVA